MIFEQLELLRKITLIEGFLWDDENISQLQLTIYMSVLFHEIIYIVLLDWMTKYYLVGIKEVHIAFMIKEILYALTN